MLSVHLPPGAHAQFKTLANQQGKSMAEIVRRMVLGYNRRHWRILIAMANAAQRDNAVKEAM